MTRTGIRVSAIIIRDSKILLIHRKKPDEEYWVFPGGGQEEGETIEETLVREVKEETNLDVLHIKEKLMIYNEASNKEEPFFICIVSDGVPEIMGEEKEKNNAGNWYKLEWISFDMVSSIFLVPDKAKEYIIKNYTK